MNDHSTWLFSDIDEAAHAKNALLESGLPQEQIRIDVLSDEAAPVEGNFALEYKDAAKDNDNSILDKVLTSNDLNEGQGRQPVDWHTVCALVAIHGGQLTHEAVRTLMSEFKTHERVTAG
ncbi:MAG: hypothetical protein ACRYGK_07840 [Janthinobacterium lividum]